MKQQEIRKRIESPKWREDAVKNEAKERNEDKVERRTGKDNANTKTNEEERTRDLQKRKKRKTE